MTTDVERLFRRLVEVLGSRGEGQLLEPIEFSELYQTIIPYRRNRTSLQFYTSEDYEMALLRLLAGEKGLVEVEPAEVREALAKEVASVHPDPGAFRLFENARARLSFEAVQQLLNARAPYAPPDATAVVLPEPAPTQAAGPSPRGPVRELPFELETAGSEAAPVRADPASCPQCSRALPAGRSIKFCPHCGGNVKVRECPQCGTQLELAWRHCVSCGHRVM